tara:strand:- start:421 stop:648 length:228 start_codon:yes stop_codon:yes gene_type:complete
MGERKSISLSTDEGATMNLNKTEIELIEYCLNHILESRPWSYFRYYSKYTEKEDLKQLEGLQKKVNKLQTKLSKK